MNLQDKICFCFFCFFCLIKYISADRTPCCDTGACANIVCQPCQNATICPNCFQNGDQNIRLPCCQQLSHIIALSAASIEASVFAYAAVEACSFAATKVMVSAITAASVGSFVSICQTVSLSINTGKCCEISADVQANATAYSSAFAAAAAEAEAAAAAVASAYGFAASAAAAAASLWAQADYLINSTCCGFDLEVYDSIIAAGKYAVNAQSCVEAGSYVSASAKACSSLCLQAATFAFASNSSISTAKIDNCCSNAHISSCANATSTACQSVCNKTSELHGYIITALDVLEAYTENINIIETPCKLVSSICTSECSDVSLSCCTTSPSSGCCTDTQNTCCLASKSIADVFLGVKAITLALATAVSYVKTSAVVYTRAIATAYSAATAATAAALSVSIEVSNCCSIKVTIDSSALAKASAVADALSESQGAADAYAHGYAYANAITQAVAQGDANATASVTAYYNGCCNSPSCCTSMTYSGSESYLRCCDIVGNVTSAFSNEYIHRIVGICVETESFAKSVSAASTSARSSDCKNLIRRVSTKTAFLLQCCCCTTNSLITSTAKQAAQTVKNDANPHRRAYPKKGKNRG